MELELKGRSCICNKATAHDQFPNELPGQKTPSIESRSGNSTSATGPLLEHISRRLQGTGQSAEFLAGTDTVGDSHIFFIVRKERTWP